MPVFLLSVFFIATKIWKLLKQRCQKRGPIDYSQNVVNFLVPSSKLQCWTTAQCPGSHSFTPSTHSSHACLSASVHVLYEPKYGATRAAHCQQVVQSSAGCCSCWVMLWCVVLCIWCNCGSVYPSVNNGDYFAFTLKDAQTVPNSSPYFALKCKNATFALNKEAAGGAGGQPWCVPIYLNSPNSSQLVSLIFNWGGDIDETQPNTRAKFLFSIRCF